MVSKRRSPSLGCSVIQPSVLDAKPPKLFAIGCCFRSLASSRFGDEPWLIVVVGGLEFECIHLHSVARHTIVLLCPLYIGSKPIRYDPSYSLHDP